MNNLLFLDIDSVLNNKTNRTMWGYYNGLPHNYGLSQNNVLEVKRILDNVKGIKIVWITTWRNHSDTFVWKLNNGYEFKSPFRAAINEFSGYQQEICPHFKHCLKSQDIYYYLQGSSDNFAILDDDESQRFDQYFKSEYFWVDCKTGVTRTLSDSVISYFKNKENNTEEKQK